MAAKIGFYLDENVPVAIATQLRRRGIEAVTTRELARLGDSDINHLKRATSMNFVLCTHDPDFVELAASGIEHAGVVLGQQHIHSIGDWVRFLELICAALEPDEMRNRVEYL